MADVSKNAALADLDNREATLNRKLQLDVMVLSSSQKESQYMVTDPGVRVGVKELGMCIANEAASCCPWDARLVMLPMASAGLRYLASDVASAGLLLHQIWNRLHLPLDVTLTLTRIRSCSM